MSVVVLGGQDDERERVVALQMGADDYVGKPLPGRELPARVRLLRRANPVSQPGHGSSVPR